MAVSVTVTATKIDITATGGVEETWATCVTAINTASAGTITIDNSNPDAIIYTITCNTGSYRTLEISSGCKIRYEQFDTLVWASSSLTTATTNLDFQAGSTIVVEEGFTFDLGWPGSGTTSQRYINFNGAITLNGTTTNHITFKNYRQLYISSIVYNFYWRYVDFKNASSATGYLIQWNQTYAYNINSTIDIKYVYISDSQGWGYVGFGSSDVHYFENLIIDTWSFYNISRMSNITGNYYFKDCSFEKVRNTYLYGVGNTVNSPYVSSVSTNYLEKNNFQTYEFFDNCTFTDCGAGTAYSIATYNQGTVYLRDCSFVGSTVTPYGVYSNGKAITLFKNVTFTNCNNTYLRKVDANGGMLFHSWDVSITVRDVNNNPIENACIIIRQSEGREKWSGFTNSSGQLKNGFGQFPVLTEKEETATQGVYTNWSDSIAGGRYHIITVTKENFSTETQNIEVTSDKTLTFVLTPINNEGTNINNATLVNAYIT